MENLITNAEHVARTAHEGQTDKTGVPYITHPERVARTAGQKAPEHLREEAQAVAWLHDTVEDTGVTLQGLSEQGFPETVIDGVDAMTKRQGEPVEGYFERVRANAIARIVKAADIDDNTDPERVQKLGQGDRTRLAAKYQRSRELLTLD